MARSDTQDGYRSDWSKFQDRTSKITATSCLMRYLRSNSQLNFARHPVNSDAESAVDLCKIISRANRGYLPLYHSLAITKISATFLGLLSSMMYFCAKKLRLFLSNFFNMFVIPNVCFLCDTSQFRAQ